MNIAQLVKKANDALQAGMQAPPPPDAAQGQPPAGPEGALPPELEQLINSLPPEALQQLLAEIQQELEAGGGQGGPQGMPPAGMPPGQDPGAGGAMPPPPPDGMPKQGSANSLIAHDARYIDGFMSQAFARGLNKQASTELYYAALELMRAPQVKQASASTNNLHCEGFTSAAQSKLGLSPKQAQELYLATFGLQS